MLKSFGRDPLRVPGESSAQHDSVQIRHARRADLPLVGAVLQLSPEAAAWPLSSLEDVFESHQKQFFVAERNNQVVGFISGRRILDEAEILNLAVTPDTRRQGIGRQLLEALLEAWWAERVLKVFLEVRESNQTAIAFYCHHGFRQSGNRPGYYRNPDEAALVLVLEQLEQDLRTAST
jgi:[ribosomal protein S18]-alanine N-acetyltransferase